MALALWPVHGFAYNDQRVQNLDSLERVVAAWTPDAIDNASTRQLVDLNNAYRSLMRGYSHVNTEKSMFYARKAIGISHPRGWNDADSDALRYIGQLFYGREQYDSAMFYYKLSLVCVDSMAAGATSPTNPEGYPQREIDDAYSALYGSIGNLYNMMDSIPEAMQWYEKAGEIFERYGWNESNSVLWYNIGETWIDEGDMRKAEAAYDKAMEYAVASADSLMIVDVWKGYGRLYMEQGKPWKSLPFLRRADTYYAAHPDYSPGFRTENLNYMKEVLSAQKRVLTWVILFCVVLLLLVVVLAVWLVRRRRVTMQVASEPPSEIKSASGVKITGREKEILDLLSKGYTAGQIADALSLSPETIKWYRKRLLVKFDVANTAELIFRAGEEGLL